MKEIIKAHHLYDLASVSQPLTWKHLTFFVETILDQASDAYLSTIYSINRSTHEKVQWSQTGTHTSHLTISPSQKYLTYLSNQTSDQTTQIFVTPLAGGAARQVTYEPGGVNQYVWHESDVLYYQTLQVDDHQEEASSTDPMHVTQLLYQDDGQGLNAENQVYLLKYLDLSLDQGRAYKVFQMTRPFGLHYVSRDESYIIYSDLLLPNDEFHYGGSVYKYDLRTGATQLLTHWIPNGVFYYGAMSENENYLLLVGNEFEYRFMTQNKLYLYDMREDLLTCFTHEMDIEVNDSMVEDFQYQASEFSIQWLDDFNYLFAATVQGETQLFQGNVDGTIEGIYEDQVHLTGGHLLEGLQDHLLVTYSTPTIPSQLGLLNLMSEELEPLYDPNQDFVKDHVLVEPEVFWTQSEDDWKVQGWYYPPVQAQEAHPVVLYIHSGPQLNYGETFYLEVQTLLGQGYGVILLNPRGSNSYGQDFLATLIGQFGQVDQKDLLAGLDQTLTLDPSIDPDRVYVTGSGYGGYLTNWLLTQTDRFRAAVAQESVSNWVSLYGTSDIGPFFVPFQVGYHLNRVDKLWKQSPLAHYQEVETPVLILHGEKDLRMPLEQAQQWYTAMKKQGVDTELMIYPKASHNLSGRGLPSQRVQRMEAISHWFQTHK